MNEYANFQAIKTTHQEFSSTLFNLPYFDKKKVDVHFLQNRCPMTVELLPREAEKQAGLTPDC